MQILTNYSAFERKLSVDAEYQNKKLGISHKKVWANQKKVNEEILFYVLSFQDYFIPYTIKQAGTGNIYH